MFIRPSGRDLAAAVSAVDDVFDTDGRLICSEVVLMEPLMIKDEPSRNSRL
jgi:hypothetical protein